MKTYIAYIDILGFKPIPSLLSKRSGFYEDVIREKFFSDPLKIKIDNIEGHTHISKGISGIEEGSDNYVITFDNMNSLFNVLGDISKIEIPHIEYNYIPLEIALDCRNIGNLDVNLKNKTEIIEFLKNDLINPYKDHYKEVNDSSITETFILLTETFLKELNCSDKNHCIDLSHIKEDLHSLPHSNLLNKCNIFEFLEHIDLKNDDPIYGMIDELYVEPIEYSEIKDSLNRDKIVFLTGTAEYGKTYTAVKLLWEYFNKGLTPKWVRGKSKEDRNESRRKLHEIRNELDEERIIYFEDPFGRISYECKDDFLEEYMELPDILKEYDNAYVIITSRGEIFSEYKKNIPVDLIKYEKTLNIKRPSYDFDKRIEILKMWAEHKGCVWLDNYKLRSFVFNELKNDAILPTTLNLRDFAESTVNVNDQSILVNKLKNTSNKTPITFANEIKRGMNKNKILFLSYIFISENFDVNFVKEQYEEMISNLQLVDETFEEVLEFFEDYKMDIKENKISFYNPTYSEALPYILFENNRLTSINNNIFMPVIFQLSKKKEAIRDVIKAIISHFKILPKSAHDLLKSISENPEYETYISRQVITQFKNISPEYSTEMLNNAVEKFPLQTISVIRHNFYSLPPEIRNNVLKTLLDYKETYRDLILLLKENFDVIDIQTRETLFMKLFDEEVSIYLIRVLITHFNKISKKNEILKFVLGFNQVKEHIFSMLYLDFHMFSIDSIEKMLIELFKFDNVHSDVAILLKKNFSDLNFELRNHLIEELFKENKFNNEVYSILNTYFGSIPEILRNKILFRLSLDKDNALISTKLVTYNYNSIPFTIRNRLLEMFLYVEDDDEEFYSTTNDLIVILLHLDKEMAIKLLSERMDIFDKKFVLDSLRILSKDESLDIRLKSLIAMENVLNLDNIY